MLTPFPQVDPAGRMPGLRPLMPYVNPRSSFPFLAGSATLCLRHYVFSRSNRVYIYPAFVNHTTAQGQLGITAGGNNSPLQPSCCQRHQTGNVHVGQITNITNQHHGNTACCGTRACYPLGGVGGGSGGMGGPGSGGVARHSHHSLATCCDSQCQVSCANAPIMEHHCSLNYHCHQGRAGLAKSAGHGAHFGNH